MDHTESRFILQLIFMQFKTQFKCLRLILPVTLLLSSLPAAGQALAGKGITSDINRVYHLANHKEAHPIDLNRSLDHYTYIQMHNSYVYGEEKVAKEQKTKKITIADLLAEGHRSFELDIMDRFKWKNSTNGPYVSHSMAKEKNACNIPHYARLMDCFNQIINFIDNRDTVVPILLFIDLKTTWNPAAAWHEGDIADLDRWIKNSRLGPYLYTYKDLRDHLGVSGSKTNLRGRLLSRGWPTLRQLNKKVLVFYTGGKHLDVNDTQAKALNKIGHTNAAGFMCPNVDANDEWEVTTSIDDISLADSRAIVCLNMKLGDNAEENLRLAAEWRLIIRTWDKSGDFDYKDSAFAYMAVANGASVFAIDGAHHGQDALPWRPSWHASRNDANAVQMRYVEWRANLPSSFALSPSSGSCVTAQSYKNGGGVKITDCPEDLGHSNVQWHYTAEGQLRPKGGGKYCLDIKGGKAGAHKKIHLWDCDGGDSEKWHIRAGNKAPWGGAMIGSYDWRYCLEKSGSSWLKTNTCNINSREQQFKLVKRPYWIGSARGSSFLPRCLDVDGANNISNGANVGTYSCAYWSGNNLKTVSEGFFLGTDGKIRTTYNNDVCLDVAGKNSSQSGANVAIWNCDEVSETFIKREDGRIGLGYNPNLCLHAVPGRRRITYGGTNVQIEKCELVNQGFDIPYSTDPKADRAAHKQALAKKPLKQGQFFLGWGKAVMKSLPPLFNKTDMCLDIVGNNSTVDGTNVALWACAGGTEGFSLGTDGKIRATYNNNICLHVRGRTPSKNGSNVAIWNCDEARGTFVKRKDGRIGLGYPNMCLDVAGINTYRNGQNIQTGRCSEVTEKFRFLGASVLAYDDNSTEPWATITAPNFTQGAFTATFAFGQSVTGFALADIGLTGGTATALNPASGAGNRFTATITPLSDNGKVRLTLAANVVQTADAHGNITASAHTVIVDNTPPTLTISSQTAQNGRAFSVMFLFNENVRDFVASDIAVSGGTLHNLRGRGRTYQASIAPSSSRTNVVLNVASGAFSDESGNASTRAVTRTINADTTAPSVTIGAPASHDGTAFTVTLTFSEAIRGLWQFENSVRSISVTGGRATNLRAISGAIDRTCNPLLCQYEGIGSRFAVTVTANNASTEVRLGMNAGAVSDHARNPNTAATTVTVAAESQQPRGEKNANSP